MDGHERGSIRRRVNLPAPGFALFSMIRPPSNRYEVVVRRDAFFSAKGTPKPFFLFFAAALLIHLLWPGIPGNQGTPLQASPSPGSDMPEIKKLPPLRSEPARGKFLIAARSLIDPNFAETVVLLIDYGPSGAMGVVINRPTRIRLSEVLPDIKGLKDKTDMLYLGGPVQRDRLILLIKTRQPPEDAHAVFDDVHVGAKPETLRQMMDRSDTDERFRAYAGYAGWSPGQLDREVSRGDWHILRADPETVFDKDESKIWPELIQYFSSKWVKTEGDTAPYRSCAPQFGHL